MHEQAHSAEEEVIKCVIESAYGLLWITAPKVRTLAEWLKWGGQGAQPPPPLLRFEPSLQ